MISCGNHQKNGTANSLNYQLWSITYDTERKFIMSKVNVLIFQQLLALVLLPECRFILRGKNHQLRMELFY